MKARSKTPGASSVGFSLVELLLAMAIVCVLMIILFNLLSSTSSVVQASTGKIQAGSEIRGALDRMSADFAGGIFRPDLPPFFDKRGGNDAFYFAAMAQGYAGDRGLSKVGYRIRSGQLERGSEGTGWTSGQMPFAESLAASDFVTGETNTNYDPLGERVFRLEMEFLMSDGSYVSSVAPSNWEDVRSVVVVVASVEDLAFKRAQGSLEDMARLLPDPGATNRALETWSSLVNDPLFLAGNAEFPASTRKGIHIRQRVFPLPKKN